MVIDRDTRQVTGPFRSATDAWDYVVDCLSPVDEYDPLLDPDSLEVTPAFGDMMDEETFHAAP